MFDSKLIREICLGLFTLALLISTATVQDVADNTLLTTSASLKSVDKLDNESKKYWLRATAVNHHFFPNGKSDVQFLDFGNEPVTWGAVGKKLPVAGTTKVISRAGVQSQIRVIDEMRKAPSKVDVVWGGEFGYAEGPIAPAWMRQYLLSQFLLENYMPVNHYGKYVLLNSIDGDQEIDPEGLKILRSLDCDWGKSGVEKFKSPEQYRLGSELDFSERNTFSFESRELSTNRTLRNAFFVQSDGPAKLLIKSNRAEGSVTFELSGSPDWKQVWLASCPLWKLQTEDETWIVTLEYGTSKVRFALPRS